MLSSASALTHPVASHGRHTLPVDLDELIESEENTEHLVKRAKKLIDEALRRKSLDCGRYIVRLDLFMAALLDEGRTESSKRYTSCTIIISFINSQSCTYISCFFPVRRKFFFFRFLIS
jgi:hypothetical protein